MVGGVMGREESWCTGGRDGGAWARVAQGWLVAWREATNVSIYIA